MSATVSATATADAAAETPSEAIAGAGRMPPTMLPERVRLLAEQSVGAAASTFVGALLIAVVLASDVVPLWVAAWVLLYLGPALWRVRFSRQIIAGHRAHDARALRHYLGFAIFNGLWTGSLPLLFFAHLSVESRVALTVVTLLALTAGAATFASYRTGYLWVLGLALPALTYDWAVYGGERSWIVVVTLCVFGVLMVRLSRHLGDVFERSVVIRFEREQVVEQLRREKALTEAARQRAEEANRAKSRFLANASHDLRQPAHALGLFTGVLEDTAQTQQHRDIARHIAAASRVLGELLDNLLDISRLDAGIVAVAPHPVALRPLLERLAADTRRLAGPRPLSIDVHCDDLVVMLDPVLVERSLRNLLDNALKFTQEGHITLSAQAQDTQLLLAVEDSGCGIPPEEHALVFEEFYQVGNAERDHRKGLGLGLSIVARLTTLMEGRVRVSSVPGEGTRFELQLPLRPVSQDLTGPDAAALPRVELAGWRVLVIDDEELVRAGMRELLCSWGAQVDEAEGLQAALARLDELGAGTAPPWRVCLCDLRLRHGEDGIVSAQQLRERLPSLPIVLITGDTAPLRIEQATRSGLPLLHKPVSPDQLAQTLRSLIEA